MSWLENQKAIEAVSQGFDVIMTPRLALYFDYYQSPLRNAEPLSINGLNTLRQVYAFEPIPEAVGDKDAHRIKGLQGNLWTEYIPTTSRLEYMAFPRVSALAEVAWSSKDRPSYDAFLKRLSHHLKRLDCQDVRYRAPMDDLIKGP